MSMSFVGTAFKLKPGAIEEEATTIGCKPAALHMFVDVEARGRGFQPNGRPIILFEAHIFGRLTKHIYDATHPNISAPAWDRSLYGAGGDHQFDRLDQAVELNRAAALQSASWGLGQVLGMNFSMVGYHTVEDFVAAMMRSERDQLDAMMDYLKSAKLLRYLVTDPPGFRELAAGYNGSGQVDHYAEALRVAYERWENQVTVAAPTLAAEPAPTAQAPVVTEAPSPAQSPPPPSAAPRFLSAIGLIARATHPEDWHADDAAEQLNAEELDRIDRIGA